MARRRFQTGSVSLETLKDGRRQWEGRYREDIMLADGTIVRRFRKVVLGSKLELPTKKLAQRALQPYLEKTNSFVPTEQDNSQSVPTVNTKALVLFETFAPRWEKEVLTGSGHYKHSQQKTAQSHLNRWLLPAFGKMPLGDVRAEAIQAFFNSMIGTASPKLMRNVRNTLASILKTARGWEYISHDPLEALVLPRYEYRKKPAYTVEEVNRILACSNGRGSILYTLAETGLRSGELCGLEVPDVDSVNRTITVRRTIWRGHAGTPKTDRGKRTFAISEKLAGIFAGLIADRTAGPVFATRNGTPFDGNNVRNREFRAARKAAGISFGDLHTLRHFNATAMDSLRVPEAVKRLRLGHADASITDRYTDALAKDDRETAEKLSTLILYPSCTLGGNTVTNGHA